MPSFLRELFGKRTLQREPEPALVMVDSDEVNAYVESGKQNAMAAAYTFFNSQASQVLHGCRRVLDLGCGPATILCHIARTNPSVNFVGLDLSDTMIAAGRKQIKEQGIENVTLVKGDITDLKQFKDGEFDGVMSTVALHHLPTLGLLKNCFKEIRRVLEPGGAVFIIDFGRLKNLQSVIQMAYLNSQEDPYLFTLDKERSMRAAFTLEEFRELTKEFLPQECRVFSTVKVPMFMIVRTPPRPIPASLEKIFNEQRLKLSPRYRSDLDDLRFFFFLDGLTSDPFEPLVPGVGQMAKLRMLDLADMPVLRSIHSSRFTRGWGLLVLGSKVLAAYTKYRLGVDVFKRDPRVLSEELYESIAKTLNKHLGVLKGPLMKFGQMTSYLTEELPPVIRAALKPLQQNSPPLAGAEIRKIVERELKQPVSKLFKEWHDVPVAAASISQLHLAKLPNDQYVIVKIRYPKILRAVRSDFFLLGFITPILGRLWGLLNYRELINEVEVLMRDECDFLRAGAFQEEFRRIFQDDPDIIIPKVYIDYSTTEVLTMDYIPGKSYEEFKNSSTQEEKNRAAVIIWRMAGTSINKHCLYNADPHPGNYLFVDGKVAFIDFGFTKRFSPEFMNFWKAQSLAGCEGDFERFAQINRQMGYEIPGRKFDHKAMYDLYRDLVYSSWEYDRPFKFTKDFVNQEMRGLLKLFQNSTGGFFMPVEFVAILRLLWGQHALLADLEAEANWHAIVYSLLKEPN